jgi:serine/threonine protein kinase
VALELSLPGFLMFKNNLTFRLQKQIAQGGGGVVYLGDALTGALSFYGKPIVVKVIGHQSNVPLSILPPREQKLFRQEISIMYFFREEKYIAKFLGWCEYPAAILMKFYQNGSLAEWIHSGTEKNKRVLTQFMRA